MPTNTFDFHIGTTGIGLGQTFDIKRVSSGVEEFLESAGVQIGVEFDAAVTVTRASGAFNWAFTVGVDGVNESLDISEPASGLEGQIEGLAVGNGKTWTCKATVTEAAS